MLLFQGLSVHRGGFEDLDNKSGYGRVGAGQCYIDIKVTKESGAEECGVGG